MMSQDFQDLSGQVINKVSKMLERAETPLNDLIAAMPAATEAAAPPELTGVQTPDKALKQDDVDDLLASLGF
jgi:chemotaxis protein CheZ